MNLLVRAYHAGKPTETHAVRSMFQTVANAIRTLKPSRVVFAMDGGHKLRSELLPEYKAHRPPEPPLLTEQKALAETAIRIAGFQAIRVPDWEADDVLATLATQCSDTVIASCDKDLLAMTGQATRCRIYHPWGEGHWMSAEEKLQIDPGQVTDFLALCGDSSDGIPGVVGIGPKTAVQLLQEYGNLEAVLTMAHLQRIPGATGKKLREQRTAALLCRRVVELNTRLPIPELDDFSPVALWRNKLQDMRLGSVAVIMETLTDQRFQRSGERGGVSATTAKVEQVECGFNGNAEGRLDAIDEVQVAQESQAPTIGSPIVGPLKWARQSIDSLPVASSTESIKYFTAGFLQLRESTPPPGTNLKPKFWGIWRDGSKWLIDPNTHRHTCVSDCPVTEWRIDSRGPVDSKTNAPRKAS